MGFDLNNDGVRIPKLYQTDPAGVITAWKACAIGKSSKTVSEFLEKNYFEKEQVAAGSSAPTSPVAMKAVGEDMERDEVVKLCVRALLEVVQTGAKNIEVVVMTDDGKIENVKDIDRIVEEINASNGEKSTTGAVPMVVV